MYALVPAAHRGGSVKRGAREALATREEPEWFAPVVDDWRRDVPLLRAATVTSGLLSPAYQY